MLRFFLLFLAILVGLFAMELTPPGQTLVRPWTASLAGISAVLIATFDHGIVSYGNIIHNPANGFGVAIEAGCNAVEACIVLAAAMLAFPAPWRHKLLGLGIGMAVVQAVNLLRMLMHESADAHGMSIEHVNKPQTCKEDLQRLCFPPRSQSAINPCRPRTPSFA